MSPLVIADSDEDESDCSPLPSPKPLRAPCAPGTAVGGIDARSSGRVSTAAESTDPVYFQNVFDEQRLAAQAVGLHDKNTVSQQSHMPSSAVTTPAPFHRTITAFERSSNVSIPDTKAPTARRKRVGSTEAEECTQTTAPQTGTTNPGDETIWDIPSSPDDGHARKRAVLGGSASSAMSKSPLGNAEARKRRRTEDAIDSTQETNIVSLVTVPPSTAKGHETDMPSTAVPSSNVDPTMPLDSYSSLAVPQRQLNSSGTATNINTPRSNLPSSRHDAYTQNAKNQSSHGKSQSSSRRRRTSSPDIIALDDAPATLEVQLPRKRESSPALEGAIHDEGDDHSDYNPEKTAKAEPSKSEVTAKKPRGRPRKKEADETPLEPIADGTDGVKETLPPTKRKRGRPKKGQPKPEESLPLPSDPQPAAEQSKAVEQTDAERPRDTMQADAQAENVAEEEPADGNKLVSTGTCPSPDTKAEAAQNPVPVAQPPSKKPGPTSLSTLTKPLYRVGLSKRSRIAPLLKSLRK